MSDYTTLCHRCGIFMQTRIGEYPCLCKKCADYMTKKKYQQNHFAEADKKMEGAEE